MNWFVSRWKKIILVCLLASTVFVWYAVFQESREGLVVSFFDVGQGDSIFIHKAMFLVLSKTLCFGRGFFGRLFFGRTFGTMNIWMGHMRKLSKTF